VQRELIQAANFSSNGTDGRHLTFREVVLTTRRRKVVGPPPLPFEAFVQSYSTKLLRAAFGLTNSYEDSQDLVQVALYRTYLHWTAARRAPEAYARTVLLNLQRDRIRQLARRPKENLGIDENQGNSSFEYENTLVQRSTLVEAVNSLPQQQKEVIVARFVFDLSVAEAARFLGVPEGTIKSSTSRSLGVLQNLLTEDPQLARRGDGR
jgi:RNA polymerase sigma factor (sigma-70 family)